MRLLLEAKREWPHGIRLPFLSRAGVADRTARNWMVLADAGLTVDEVAAPAAK